MATQAELLYVIRTQDQDLKKLQREVRDLNKQLGRDVPDASQKAAVGLGKPGGKLNELTQKLGVTQEGWEKFGRVAKRTALVVGALGAVGMKKSIDAASDLTESINKADAVFKGSAKGIQEWSKTSATAMGLSRAAALEGASSIGNMLVPMGVAPKRAAEMSKTMAQLAADMGSFNNQDPTEMLDRIQSGLSGEMEPLKRFGSVLSEARVKQFAYAEGIAKTGETLTETQKIQARYGLLLKDTAGQQGDFARNSGELENMQRTVKAQVTDLAAKLGGLLLPAIKQAAAWASQLVAWFDRNRKVLYVLIGVAASFVAIVMTVTAVMKVAGAVAKVWAAAQWVLNAAMNANPLVRVVTVLALLAAGLVVAYQRSETFRAIVDTALRAVVAAFDWVVDKGAALVGFFTDTLPGAASAALSWVSSNWPAIATIISGPFAPLVALATDAWGVRSGITTAINATKTWVSSNWPVIATILSGPFAPLVALATDAFGVRSAMMGGLNTLKTTAGTAAGNISGAIKSGFMGIVWDIPKALYDRIIQPMIDKVAEVLQKAKDLSSEIPKGIRSITWGLLETFRERIIQPLVDLAANALDKGGDIAKAIGRGIREGAAEVWDKVTDAFKTFLNRIISVVNKVPFVNIPLLARGGVIGGPTLAVVGEDGPEVVIPLGRKRRKRGVELMTQAASIMGMEGDWAGPVSRARAAGIPFLAEGGFVIPGQFQGAGLDALYSSVLRAENNPGILERAAAVLAKGVGWVLNQLPMPSFGNAVLDGLGKATRAAAAGTIGNAWKSAEKYNVDGILDARRWAISQMGKPYVWGGGHGGWNYNLAGYDCSGFASHVAKKAGSSIGAPGTTMSLFPASAAGHGPITWGFRGMGSNDPRRQHMGAKVLSNWYQFGNPGHSGGGDGQWDSLRVPPGLASYQRGTPYVPQTGPAVLHQGEKVVPREGSLVHIENYYARSDTDAEVLAAGLSRKLALGGVG